MKTIKPMLAKPYTATSKTPGWLMSEKLDGVRAIWNGENLMTRNNNIIRAPRWFTDPLPKDVVLDGELWLGRGCFQKAVGIVRSHDGDWSGMQFMVFDTVQEGDYSQRYAALKALPLPSHVTVLEQFTYACPADLDAFEANILSQGGEGVIIRNPSAGYQQKRTSDLLKVKRYQDAEVVVIDTEQGTGRNAGLIGALVARFNGQLFNIGSGLTDKDRAQPARYWLNKTVTFSFFGLTDNGIPRHPAFIGVRDYE